MAKIFESVVGRKREALRPSKAVQQGRALEDSELDRIVGGFGLGLSMVGPQVLSLSTMTAGPNLSAGSMLGPLGLFPSTVSPGVGVVNAVALSGGFSGFTGAGSDRGEP